MTDCLHCGGALRGNACSQCGRAQAPLQGVPPTAYRSAGPAIRCAPPRTVRPTYAQPARSAKELARSAVESRAPEMVVVTFSDKASVVSGPCPLRRCPDTLSVRIGSTTNFHAGLSAALKQGVTALLLMSDGYSTDDGRYRTLLEELRGLYVACVAYGKSADRAALQEIAPRPELVFEAAKDAAGSLGKALAKTTTMLSQMAVPGKRRRLGVVLDVSASMSSHKGELERGYAEMIAALKKLWLL